MRVSSCLLGAVTAGALSGALASAAIFQPDSAVAGSEFSGSYDIGNAINGSGLPAGFGPGDVHSTYVAHNHWTTQSGALDAGNAWAEFMFDAPVTIGTFHLWNHLSNGVASDGGYAVTLFDLELFDSDDNSLALMSNVAATPNVHVAQTYDFAPVDDVSRVRFTILANNGSPQYTGVAEVAFDVPAPGAMALLGVGGLALGRRRRG